METVEGRQAVFEAIKSRKRISKIYMAQNIKPSDIIQKIKALANEQGVYIERVDKVQLDKMARSRVHQGVIAQVGTYKYLPLTELLAGIDMEKKPTLLLLDGITDPQNFGALLRTADAAGVAGVVVAKRRAAPMTAAVHKASAGATAYVKIAQVSNLAYTIDDLKEVGFWVIGASEKSATAYFEADFNQPIAVVLGSEGKGISRLVAEKCDFLVAIPMKGEVSSLNVSVAGAILMYEALRQRSQ